MLNEKGVACVYWQGEGVLLWIGHQSSTAELGWAVYESGTRLKLYKVLWLGSEC